jgi:hypothetical protein
MCGTPVELIGDQVWSPDEVTPRPGLSYANGTSLAQARQEVVGYFPDYLRRARSTGSAIEQFVQTVNEHFTNVSE